MTNTTDTQQASRLLGLPAELRNRIWHYVLPSNDKVHPACARCVTLDFETHTICGVKGDPKEYEPVPSLLQTCRQVRGETRPIYIAGNTFTFDFFTEQDVEDWRSWCTSLGSDARHLRSLHFFIDITGEASMDDLLYEHAEHLCKLELSFPDPGCDSTISVKGDVVPEWKENVSGHPLTAVSGKLERRVKLLSTKLRQGLSDVAEVKEENESDTAWSEVLAVVVGDLVGNGQFCTVMKDEETLEDKWCWWDEDY